ncbi:MAG: aminodeoxychorismate/anthranilate synthase component II [Bacteroidota bacterium]|nr:aminodeoxychorismate/anthranilate synthase component II [Bacteroidota bacterium]
MHILLLDNYDSFTYNLAQILRESKLCTFDIVKNDKIVISEVVKYDKILLSPGAGIPSEAGKMLKLIELFYQKKPILGICLGMQAIAEFFGGEIFNMNTVFHGIKEEIKILSHDYLFENFDITENVGLYHSWAVCENNLPKELKITAISKNNIIMALKHEDFDICGVQFHPESYITKNGRKIIENWLKK